ncbi:MAG: glycosyltransferase family 39 protein [Treponema sp.]|nr:glycosyltransferase family 39 protein [Treponema sp.]
MLHKADGALNFCDYLISRKSALFLCIAAYSFGMLLLFSMSSPLYYINKEVDVHAYFNMGKGLFNGKVIYRDLFDHKGPLLYFIYGLGYLISGRNFLGIYILEAVFLTITLSCLFKTVSLFIKNKHALLAIPVYAAILLNEKIFDDGGHAEEFCLPFIMAGLFYLVKMWRNEENFKFGVKEGVILGFCTAALLLIKMTMAAVFVPFLLCAAIYLCKSKKIAVLLKFITGFVLGLLFIFTPFFIYLVLTKSFNDFYLAYIKFNAIYSGVHFNIDTIIKFIKSARRAYLSNEPIPLIIIAGILFFCCRKKYVTLSGRISIVLSFIFLLFVIYLSGRRYANNFIPLTVFIVFALIIAINEVLPKIFKGRKIEYLLLLLLLCIPSNNNIRFLRFVSDEHAVVKIGKRIAGDDQATLLYYRQMDFGIFTTAGLIPSNKYFYKAGIEPGLWPEMFEEQDRIVKNGEVKYIALSTPPVFLDENLPAILTDNYHVIETYEVDREEYNITLLKRKEE